MFGNFDNLVRVTCPPCPDIVVHEVVVPKKPDYQVEPEEHSKSERIAHWCPWRGMERAHNGFQQEGFDESCVP